MLQSAVLESNDYNIISHRLVASLPTWILVEYLARVVEVRVPVVPLAAQEAELLACDAHVRGRPVLRVGAHGAPRAGLEHLHDALMHVGAVDEAHRAVRLLRGHAVEGKEPAARFSRSLPLALLHWS